MILVEGSAEADAFHALMPRLDASRANGVAEPCRVLVILDFPTNVGGATARLLQTILQKGPSHSVHPILMVDNDKQLPYGINMLELEQNTTTIAWDGRRFVWQDPDFRSAWIEFDKPPRAPIAKQILRGVQQAAAEPPVACSA
jgi:hypothetical protein